MLKYALEPVKKDTESKKNNNKHNASTKNHSTGSVDYRNEQNCIDCYLA